MSKTSKQKVNKEKSSLDKSAVAIIVAVALIFGYIAYECYTVTHVPLETKTAIVTTVYDTLDVTALAVRDEHTVANPSGGVTVAIAANGEKVGKNGKIAMIFDSSQKAQEYSQKLALSEELQHYQDLESKSSGASANVKSIDIETVGIVNDYIRNVNHGNYASATSTATQLNDSFTRRQMIIGKEIDFVSIKKGIQSKIDALSTGSVPSGYVSTDESGIFSTGADGMEKSVDYKNIDSLSTKDISSSIENAKNSKPPSNVLGKVITSYSWYFCCNVDSSRLRNYKKGDKIEVAMKNSNKVFQCEIATDLSGGAKSKETALLLKCADMDSEIATYRTEDIELRFNSYTGVKVPVSAIHVENGKKGVYALVSSEVKFRQADIVYSTDDFVLLNYNPDNSNGIRLYDEIITEGKDLYNGRVYT